MEKEYVLVIDDSKLVNKGLTKAIEENCHIPVLSAYSYKETKKLIKEYGKQIVLAVVDLNLPDCKEAEAVDLTLDNHINSAVLTGNFSESTREKLLKKKVSDFFLKESSDTFNIVSSFTKRILKNRETKIVVAQNSKLYLSLFKNILQRQMFDPILVKNGDEALKAFEENPDIKLIVTDYDMPQTDGLTLTQKLRKNYSKDEVAIIVISDSEAKNITSKFLKYGANDFIKKPFSDDEVITRINSSLDILDLFQESKDRANKDFMTGMYNRRYFFDQGGHTV